MIQAREGEERRREISIVCLASYCKGHEFLRECKRLGCRVILLTREKLLHQDWPRESLDAIITVANDAAPDEYIEAVCEVARRVSVDLVVALEEFDVLTASRIREHLCLQGITRTMARLFRDKLAMRFAAAQAGILEPQFVRLFNYQEIGEFMERVPAPWVMKPRTIASAIGIRKLHRAEDVWRTLDILDAHTELHEKSQDYLLEQFIPGEVFHVDSLVNRSGILFAGVNRYAHPPLEIAQGGGVPISYTVKYDSPDQKRLLRANRKLIKTFGLTHGVTHAEFIRSAETGKFYFLEIAARVGGALTAETLEAASGLNLWREWARVEVAAHEGRAYQPFVERRDYAGIALSLARQEYPDTSCFTDPEIVMHVHVPHHVGLIIRSTQQERVLELLTAYARRFQEEFTMILPPQEKPQ
jgi:biotin carboxylase